MKSASHINHSCSHGCCRPGRRVGRFETLGLLFVVFSFLADSSLAVASRPAAAAAAAAAASLRDKAAAPSSPSPSQSPGSPPQVRLKLDVDTTSASSWRMAERLQAVGLEYLNHEIYGGLYSQMVFGESFEEAAAGEEEVEDEDDEAKRGDDDINAHFSTLTTTSSSDDAEDESFKHTAGFLSEGYDLAVGNMTYAEARAECGANARCCGFTFRSDDAAPTRPVRCYLKAFCSFVPAQGWQAYQRPKPPGPAQWGARGCRASLRHETARPGATSAGVSKIGMRNRL